MKNYIFGAVFSLGILAAPALAQAAALTTAQSTSLIAVVQSSPGTPASAFVNLITSFSNITINQATSLIAVVQTSPSVSANAFVNLLTSFTNDSSIVPSTSTATTTTQSTNLVQPTISLSSSTGPAGTKVTVYGTGFNDHGHPLVSFNGDAVPTETNVEYGAVKTNFFFHFVVPSTLINCPLGTLLVCNGIPYSVSPATYNVQVVNTDDGIGSNILPFTVTQAPTTTIPTASPTNTKCSGSLLCPASA